MKWILRSLFHCCDLAMVLRVVVAFSWSVPCCVSAFSFLSFLVLVMILVVVCMSDAVDVVFGFDVVGVLPKLVGVDLL